MTTTRVANEASKKNEVKKTAPASTASNPDLDALPEGCSEIGVDRNLYKNDSANPIQGYLLGFVELPNAGNKIGKDGKYTWDAFIVRTTAPCQVLTKKNDNGKRDELMSKVGDEVIVPANYRLKQLLAAQANNPKFVFKVFIRPTTTQDLGGGKTLQLFKTGIFKEIQPRNGTNVLMGAALVPTEVRLLPGSSFGEQQGDDSVIPF